MNFDNDVRITKRDPRNMSGLGRSKPRSYVCGPKFTEFSEHAQGRALCNAVVHSTISCFVPEIFANKLRSCTYFAPDFDVLDRPTFWGREGGIPPSLPQETPISDQIL